MLEFELVLPCYNESKSLEALLGRGIEAAKKHGFTPERFQLVLVENGSRDNSREVMKTLAQNPQFGPWFRIVPVDQNQGYGFGLHSGLKTTTAPYIAWSHADQQCDPEDAFRALEIQKQNPTERVLVKGLRHGRSFQERLVSRVFEFLAWFFVGYRLYEINAQPKVFKRDLLALIKNPPYDFAYDLYVLYMARRAGYKITTIDVKFPPRIHGLSNWASNLKSRRRTIWNMILYMARLRGSH